MLIDQSEFISRIGDVKTCDRIIAAWKQAAFSASPDHSVQRYFKYQLTVLAEQQMKNSEAEQQQLRLVHELLRFLPDAVQSDFSAPDCYRKWLIVQLRAPLRRLSSIISTNPEFEGVGEFIDEMTKPGTSIVFRFRTLTYFERLIRVLDESVPDLFHQKLIELNFNYLNYWSGLLRKLEGELNHLPDVESRSQYLRAEGAKLKLLPDSGFMAYHADWPSLKILLAGWIDEQLTAGCSRQSINEAKLSLNISVAQLACWLRLLYEEGLFKETNLKAIFQFFADHFTTKKQSSISTGGLSKEYYTGAQVPAALAKDHLEKMLSRLIRHFFPVWIVISALPFFH